MGRNGGGVLFSWLACSSGLHTYWIVFFFAWLGEKGSPAVCGVVHGVLAWGAVFQRLTIYIWRAGIV
jgi:hypothetical protein